MRTYSIKELENLSGTKAHTIRIWEQRYALLNPSRTETGIRYYSDIDLKKILATSVLLKNGVKISKIALLSQYEIQEKLEEIDQNTKITDSKIELSINKLIEAGIAFDEFSFLNEFDKLDAIFDTKKIFISIVYPLLNRIGIMWSKDEMSPLQEHFISTIIRQKIISAINNLPTCNQNAKKIVLFLPEKETHEIGLLLTNFIFKSQNIRTIYFGQQVPISNLIEFLNQYNIKHAFGFIFYSHGKNKLNSILNLLNEKCQKTHFYWAGYLPKDIEKLKNQTLVNSIENIEDIIKIVKND